jgi:hypothetical protein
MEGDLHFVGTGGQKYCIRRFAASDEDALCSLLHFNIVMEQSQGRSDKFRAGEDE